MSTPPSQPVPPPPPPYHVDGLPSDRHLLLHDCSCVAVYRLKRRGLWKRVSHPDKQFLTRIPVKFLPSLAYSLCNRLRSLGVHFEDSDPQTNDREIVLKCGGKGIHPGLFQSVVGDVWELASLEYQKIELKAFVSALMLDAYAGGVGAYFAEQNPEKDIVYQHDYPDGRPEIIQYDYHRITCTHYTQSVYRLAKTAKHAQPYLDTRVNGYALNWELIYRGDADATEFNSIIRDMDRHLPKTTIPLDCVRSPDGHSPAGTPILPVMAAAPASAQLWGAPQNIDLSLPPTVDTTINYPAECNRNSFHEDAITGIHIYIQSTGPPSSTGPPTATGPRVSGLGVR